MNISDKLKAEVMWKATVTCDDRYDGEFFYAVKTTGIFCRPSCKSRTPQLNNVRFFKYAQEALREGFRPCKRCRPDIYVRHYDPSQEIVEDVQTILENRYDEKIQLKNLAQDVGLSPFYLNRLFKEKTGFTPRQYLEKVRIQKAVLLLKTTDLSSTEIGFQVGYENLSSFYKAFKNVTGCSPGEYRKM